MQQDNSSLVAQLEEEQYKKETEIKEITSKETELFK
jgi:hypothetical protein